MKYGFPSYTEQNLYIKVFKTKFILSKRFQFDSAEIAQEAVKSQAISQGYTGVQELENNFLLLSKDLN